jgi:hypothetical protein
VGRIAKVGDRNGVKNDATEAFDEKKFRPAITHRPAVVPDSNPSVPER